MNEGQMEGKVQLHCAEGSCGPHGNGIHYIALQWEAHCGMKVDKRRSKIRGRAKFTRNCQVAFDANGIWNGGR